jgi:predicted RNA-binding protein YlxR (DUF448 family)
MKEKPLLIRVVVSPVGEIAADISGKAHGRGAYICRKNVCIDKAQKTRGLERSLKRSVPAEIYENVRWLNAEGSCSRISQGA